MHPDNVPMSSAPDWLRPLLPGRHITSGPDCGVEADGESVEEARDGDARELLHFERSYLPHHASYQYFRKRGLTKAVRLRSAFTVETREGTLRCDDGWLAWDANGDPYPIAADVFEATYVEVDPIGASEELWLTKAFFTGTGPGVWIATSAPDVARREGRPVIRVREVHDGQ